MAKVAVPGSLPSTSLEIGGGTLKVGKRVRRKTPSELRGEQLQRTSVTELVGESPYPLHGSIGMKDSGHKKPELSRNPRYIDTRMDEVYPAKKSRFRILSGKRSAKDNSSMEQSSILKNLCVPSILPANGQQQLPGQERSAASAEVSEDGAVRTSQMTEKSIQSTFLSVAELSTGGDKLSSLAPIDMDKALKGLAVLKNSSTSGLRDDSSERCPIPTSTYSGNFCSECHVPGQKAPLDFTLKTTMRVVSSINWSNVQGIMPQFPFQDKIMNSSSGFTSSSQVVSSKVLHSWIYPQSTLPPSLITVLSSSAANGVEMDFLRRRQLAWEESFQTLYYMLRNNICDIFYVCTSHFVVMITGCGGSVGAKRLCNAYISQSTRGLRSLLSEHDVSFSMPLCCSKIEQATAEDLVELSEIEKHNLGQARRLNSMSDVDNTPESLLVFSGNRNVHSLYDFLLNHRSLLTSLTGMDVPVLYSPVPFQNAAISSPEVRCIKTKMADHIIASEGCIFKDGETIPPSSSGVFYNVEIKDTYIPPWIVSRICAVLCSEGRSFEASFITEPTSIGLNVALGSACEKSETAATGGESFAENCCTFGIPDATVSPSLRSGLLKGLKYSNGSYTASLGPV